MTYASVRVIYVIPFENQIGGYDTERFRQILIEDTISFDIFLK